MRNGKSEAHRPDNQEQIVLFGVYRVKHVNTDFVSL